MAVQVGRSVVSFTIKNIDIDRRMREKLKKEIRPLLSNHNKDKDLLQFKASNGGDNADKANAN
eukprot:CAMPEP_0116879106 /NCGR_PEP_ID=MMETSP0463-20121206/10860_1 /TAXON_ID=181622 /ORGANISM="Strombidinopsis sp, Strain SopsisLIS2011" /LENGTH=62 /DNA_ID=CAMNT_0004528003 /DNA_START=1197 /DNA_END=1385 /DNA_ORIENTATION=+